MLIEGYEKRAVDPKVTPAGTRTAIAKGQERREIDAPLFWNYPTRA